ncbi:MAG TPA: galactosyldiacylglycerol synthase [Bryobacteraceae bacterium]|nr:galactosyldiacylglycerol synthase [Bryobacteraceae bacterium]
MTKVDFLYFDAGGGHRAAATALKAVIDEQKRPWDVELVNLQEILGPLDVFRKVTGLELQEIYNQMLARGWTLGSAQGLKFMHGVIRLYHRPAVRMLEKYWATARPDLVVSLVPNFNRAMFESARRALPSVPYVTILTDLADYPPHFWMEKQEQFLICGSDKAVAQARALGFTGHRIFRASGMILRPGFYQPVTVDRVAERRRLGLDPDRPTGLVLFGGQGSKVMLEIAERLADTQLILICGKNAGLADRLRRLPVRASRYVEGFTSEIPYYMSLADFFIGKPGPGSISEAVAMTLPVIVERNMWTLPQERYNADWVLERNAGLVVPNFRGIAGAVSELLRDLPRYQAAVKQIHNRAVFEIPEMLAKILDSPGSKTAS